ncbi:phosphatase 2C-like domain-containing protein [Scenedesmus sp. NREL 46B-D3]|nr:phosphatase 2C-like domain-containing protein [Scenedesmus sp. NREL 46B-D3]
MAVPQALPQAAPQPVRTHGEQIAGYAQNQQASLYDDIPILVHANEQKALKSEDVIYVRRVEASYGNVHSIFMVCDGHQGAGAAVHCVEHMPGLLGQLLPAGLPDWSNTRDVVEYAEKVRRAVSTAAVLLDNEWTRMVETGVANVQDNAGTTMTLAVVSGWLLTVANTGDSNAIIDCGDSVQEITYSHRIQVNKNEQNRLRQAGAQLAPLGFHLQGPAKPQEMGVGPLRMWPGGLCVSRSIGDLDAGPLIVPLPHVRQVLLTRHRALRLIMASDGLWDLMSFSKAAKSVRHKLPHQAVSTLAQVVARDKRMADDVSIIILDMLPPPAPGITPQQFPASTLKASSAKSSGAVFGRSNSSSSRSGKSSGGLFACFKSSAVQEDEAYHAGSGGAAIPQHPVATTGPLAQPWAGLAFLADVDCYETYPVHGKQLARAAGPAARRPSPPPKRRSDYTVHGGHAHRFQQDSSWHTGDSQHGSNNLPMFLSQSQIEQLLADGPAAAAGMVLGQPELCNNDAASPFEHAHGAGAGTQGAHGRAAPDREALMMMGSGMLDSLAAAADAALAGEGCVHHGNSARVHAGAADPNNRSSGGSQPVNMHLNSRPSHLQPTEAYDAPSGAEAWSRGSAFTGTQSASYGATGAHGGVPKAGGRASGAAPCSGMRPSSPDPGALHRCASAEFEDADGARRYVAADEGPVHGSKVAAPGRVVGMHPAGPMLPSHFGSAPMAAPGGRRDEQHPASLAAAAAGADEDEDGLRMMGVRCALVSDEYGRQGGRS